MNTSTDDKLTINFVIIINIYYCVCNTALFTNGRKCSPLNLQ